MYHTPTENRTARKKHRCTSCGEDVLPGEIYSRWTSFEDSSFRNKMHPECLDAHRRDSFFCGDSGGFEYTLYANERPKKIGE